MEERIKALIAELKNTIRFVELRKAPPAGDYLEGVLLRKDLSRCCGLLAKAFGPPLKEFGQPAAFAPDAQQAVDAAGGIRVNQCFFLAPQGAGGVAYAALWPWESNPTRLTLKVGAWQAR